MWSGAKLVKFGELLLGAAFPHDRLRAQTLSGTPPCNWTASAKSAVTPNTSQDTTCKAAAFLEAFRTRSIIRRWVRALAVRCVVGGEIRLFQEAGQRKAEIYRSRRLFWAAWRGPKGKASQALLPSPPKVRVFAGFTMESKRTKAETAVRRRGRETQRLRGVVGVVCGALRNIEATVTRSDPQLGSSLALHKRASLCPSPP